MVFFGGRQSAEKIGKLLGHEAVPFAKLDGTIRFVPAMCEAVERLFEALELRKLARFGGRVRHVGDLVGRDASRVGAKSQVHQVIHRANE